MTNRTNSLRLWAFGMVAVCLGVSGCSRLSGIPDKVNEAFPPSAEIRVAESDLREHLASDKDALNAFEKQYATRLELRALNCSRDLSIGRFDSVSEVKALPINRDCLNGQDTELLQFMGIRQVATRHALPPLRPLEPLGPAAPVIPDMVGTTTMAAIAASDAGVAVLKGITGEMATISLPKFEKIASLPTIPGTTEGMQLSPNGRVAAVPSTNNAEMTFIDTETGRKLWETKEFNHMLAWLPEIQAALVGDGRHGTALLLDFAANKLETQLKGRMGYAWAMTVSRSPARILLGSMKQFSRIEYKRGQGGIEQNVLKTYEIQQGSGILGYQIALMRNGKALVFVSGRNLMMVDLDSGAETLWPMEGMLANRFAKLNETELLVNSYRSDEGINARVFDIEQATLAPVVSWDKRLGYVGGLSGRAGYFWRTDKISIGDKVETGDAVPWNEAAEAYEVEHQQTILAASRFARADNWQYSVPYPEMPAPALAAPPTSFAYSSPRAHSSGVITDLVKGARVEAVGVYQGVGSQHQARSNERQAGAVVVHVKSTAQPIVLVLSSYEPVRWILLPESGVKITAILLSGYYQSSVVGGGGARILSTGRTHAYKMDSPEYGALNLEVMRYFGKKIDVFQGRYEGATFDVGG